MTETGGGKPNGQNGSGKKQRLWTMIAAVLAAVVLISQSIGAGSVLEPWMPAHRGYVRDQAIIAIGELRDELTEAIGDIVVVLQNLTEVQLGEKSARLKSEIVSLEAQSAQMNELLASAPENSSKLRVVIRQLEQQISDNKSARAGVLCQIDVLSGINRAC